MTVAYFKQKGILVKFSGNDCRYSPQSFFNCRIEHIWNEEIQQKGLSEASLIRVVWKSVRTRVIVQAFVYLLALTFGFLETVSGVEI